MTLGEFSGGGLWVKEESGKGPVVIKDFRGEDQSGRVVHVRNNPTRLIGSGGRLLPWIADEFWTLVAWVSPRRDVWSEDDLEAIKGLGFRSWWPEDHQMGSNQELKVEITPNFKADRGFNLSVAAISLEEETGPEPSHQEPEGWDVDFPHQVVDDSWVEGTAAWNNAVSHACQSSVKQICGAADGLDISLGLEAWERAFHERSWCEDDLSRVQGHEGASCALRSLSMDVPLADVPRLLQSCFFRRVL